MRRTAKNCFDSRALLDGQFFAHSRERLARFAGLASLLLSLSLAAWPQPASIHQLLEQRQYEQALRLARQAVSHSPEPESYRWLGECLLYCGHLKESQQAYEAGLAAQPADPLPLWQGLARCLNEQGQDKLAQPVYEQIIKALGPDHPQLALTLNQLGGVAYRSRDFARAESAYRQAAAMLENQPGPNLSSVLDSLGLVLAAEQKPAEALEFFRRALALRLKYLGADHLLVADTLTHMGPVDPGNAAEDYRKALAILEKGLGPDDPGLVGLLDRMGRFYEDAGDLARAQPLYERALANSPRDSLRRAQVQEDLAGLYRQKRTWQLAAKYYQEASLGLERNLGANHPETIIALANYGLYLQELGDLDEANKVYQKAVPLLRAMPDRQDYLASALLGVGQLQMRLGDLTQAEASLAEARQLWSGLYGERFARLGLVTANQARLWHEKGDYARAEQGYTEARDLLGDTPEAEILQDSQARLKLDQQQPELARQLASQSLASRRLIAANVLAYSSEAERFLYFQEFRPYDMLATLSSPETLAALLSFKGLVLNSILEDQRLAARQPEKRALLKELHKLQWQWSRSRSGPNLSNLKLEIGRLEAALGSDVPLRQALAVTPAQVQKQLPERTSLVEFVCYRHYLGNGKRGENRLAALLLSPEGPPAFVPLGSAADYKQRLAKYRLLWQQADSPDTVLRELYQQVWEPVAKQLPAGTEAVLLAPDGELNALSFATLLDAQGEFLGEKLRISYLASGRDLLAPARKLQRKTMVLVCNPDFGQARPEETIFVPLPGTAREAGSLETVAKAAGLTVTVVTQRAATEAYVKGLKSPGILHLATHGFLLPENSYQYKTSLRLSGLALAGAQTTLTRWSHDDFPDPAGDGVLNAEEFAAVPLDQTWLVTLSACDTAIGKNLEGEGVLGLRRGVAHAGAQNLLMTLWPIADQETADFMKDFYTRALDSGDARLALAQTQRDWLRRLRQSVGAVRAARLAGPFVLSFKGALR